MNFVASVVTKHGMFLGTRGIANILIYPLIFLIYTSMSTRASHGISIIYKYALG